MKFWAPIRQSGSYVMLSATAFNSVVRGIGDDISIALFLLHCFASVLVAATLARDAQIDRWAKLTVIYIIVLGVLGILMSLLTNALSVPLDRTLPLSYVLAAQVVLFPAVLAWAHVHRTK